MRCTNCGHQGGTKATFCLNCGTRLGPAPLGGTQSGLGGIAKIDLPPKATRTICSQCNADNAGTMKFCRECGAALHVVAKGGTESQSVPIRRQSAPVVRSAPMAQATAAGKSKSLNATMMVTPSVQSPTPVPQPVVGTPLPSIGRRASTPTPPPGMRVVAVAPASEQTCGSCGGITPGGFAFCQRCGKSLNAVAEVKEAREKDRGIGDAVSSEMSAKSALGKTIADIPWASLVSVNRDGSDGVSHALVGNFVEIGTSEAAALHFTDPFLASFHARIERLGASSARLVPLDKLNGVFVRLRKETPLTDGAMILVGRELLRFEVLCERESKAEQLVQHGVSLLGSPRRKPWARLSQLLPSGGILDIRNLYGEEMCLGREEGALVFSDDEFLSRQHARFRWKNGTCSLVDLGSSNGTFLRIAEPVNLSDGDFVRMGDQLFRFKPTT